MPGVAEGTTIESRNATFFENDHPCKRQEDRSSERIMVEFTSSNPPKRTRLSPGDVEPRRGKRVKLLRHLVPTS